MASISRCSCKKHNSQIVAYTGLHMTYDTESMTDCSNAFKRSMITVFWHPNIYPFTYQDSEISIHVITMWWRHYVMCNDAAVELGWLIMIASKYSPTSLLYMAKFMLYSVMNLTIDMSTWVCVLYSIICT